MSDNPTPAKRISYQPEYVFGAIPDVNGRWTGQYGLKPWPAHLQPHREAADSDGGTQPTEFLAVTPSMRKKLAATCEALIALLDEIDGDAEEEPILGAPEAAPTPYSGKRGPVYGGQARDGEGDQTNWAAGCDDDREDGGDDLEPEPSGYGDEEGMLVEEWGEPDLGFCGHGIGWREGEATDDRDVDAGDEREPDTDFEASLGWSIPGGQHDLGMGECPAAVDCHYDGEIGVVGDGSGKRIAKKQLKEHARRKQSAGRKGEILFQRDEGDNTPMPRYMWNDQWTGNLPPEAFDVLDPDISMYREPK